MGLQMGALLAHDSDCDGLSLWPAAYLWLSASSSDRTMFSLVSMSYGRELRPLKSRGRAPGFLGLRHLDLTAIWPTEFVRIQYLRVTDIGNARIIVEKLQCEPIRDLQSHIPIFGEHLDFYIRLGIGNAGLP